MKNGWQEKQLGELAELRGRIGWRGLTAKEYTKSGPLFLSVHSLNYGDYVDFRDAFHISEERYTESPEIMLKQSDVLICKDGAGIGKVGIVGELPDRTTINSSLLLIRSGKDILPKFLYRCLSSPYFQRIVNSRLNGATTPHLYQRDITEFPVVLPPVPEQRRIVGILDKAFDGIATAKANAEKNLQNAHALFQSHLNAVFTQRGSGWGETTIGAQMTFQREFDITKTEQEPGTIPVVSSGGIKSFHNKAMTHAPGIVIGRKGTLGKVFYLSVDYWPHDTTLWIKDFKGNYPRFVYHFLRRLDVAHLDTGTANPALNRNVLHPIPVVWPDVTLQFAIAEKFDALEVETQRLESIYQRKLAALDELKKSLLHQGFSGQL